MKRFISVVSLAFIYFGSVYFAVYALEPVLAAPMAWFSVLMAMLAFLLIDSVFGEVPNLPIAILFLFPFVCVVAGLLWWLLRALGFYRPLIR